MADSIKRFGQPIYIFDLQQEAMDLQLLFEFDDSLTEVAWILSQEEAVPLQEAFLLVEKYISSTSFMNGTIRKRVNIIKREINNCLAIKESEVRTNVL